MGDFSNKTIIVTGASGLIGSNLVLRLLEDRTTKVIAIGRNKKKLSQVFEAYLADENLTILEHDIGNPLVMDEAIDYIFHAAGPISGNIIRETPVTVIRPNIMGTLNMLNFMSKQREEKNKEAKLIIFSSATVYGNTYCEDTVVHEEDTSIADGLDAINAPYSESKRMVEVIAKAYAKQERLSASIVRFSYVYGYTKSLPNTAFYEFIKKALAGEDIVLNNAGLPRRDNIYIEDAIDGLLTVAARGLNGESYNISTNMQGSNFAAVDEMAFVIADIVNEKNGTNVKVLYKEDDYISERAPGIVLCNDKLKALGWNVNNDLKRGIEKTIDFFS
ncbi:MAG: NAD(P)-dependent oxidoreductase [Lachnospiraceae bacterium]|nr:NAD(P)-dependent oxidoreductase [Lachnospiraceae bacterium]